MSARGTLVFWGTYDTGKPRQRLLRDAAAALGFQVSEINAAIWCGLDDKPVARRSVLFGRMLRAAAAYPVLVIRFMLRERPRAVIISHLGHIDLLVIVLFARVRRVPIIWDLFIPLHETIVEDRRMLDGRSILARLLHRFEGFCTGLPRMIITDTAAHARFLESEFSLDSGTVGVVLVGSESPFRPLGHRRAGNAELSVAFYGQCIPLHGLETIVEAAALLERRGEPIRWRIVGSGQEERRIDELVAERKLRSVERLRWVAYEELPALIADADVCLGIFGTSGKASRVIPNKVFQCLACRRPLITRDSPAIRELVPEPSTLIRFVPAGDAVALAEAVLSIRSALASAPRSESETFPLFDVRAVAAQLEAVFRDVIPASFSNVNGEPSAPELHFR